MNKIYELADLEFIQLIESSCNIAEVLFKLGMTTKGNSWGYSQVKQRMIDLAMDYSRFKGKKVMKDNREKTISADKILSSNCKHSRSVLRRYIIKNNLIDYRCAICGMNQWNGKTLSLEIDHIDGINNNNTLNNLRFLCPNCHSQTTTYGSRNQQLNASKYDITDKLTELVLKEYSRTNSKKKTSKNLNVRKIVIDTIIAKEGLSKTNQRYVVQYDEYWNEINRFGSISELCSKLIEENKVKTKKIKTCRSTFLRNYDKFWLDSYWKIMDA